MVHLRPYQRDAIERLRVLIRNGETRILLVLPTGGGKTVVASSMITTALAKQRRVLFVGHRREILGQTFNKLREFGVPREQLSILMGSDPRYRPGAAVQIASIQTLNNRDKPPADLVFFDEAHRAISRSYKVLDALYPQAVNIGLTASPWRADGKGLCEIYKRLEVVATPRELIDLGYLVEPRCWTVPEDQLPDLRDVQRRGSDYDERQLALAVDKAKLVGNIVEHWHKHAGGRRTVVFAVSVDHSRRIVDSFIAAGVRAEHLDGTTPNGQRDAILARLASGETQVVSNCSVLQEGWDSPAVKCAVLARPTLSLALHIQQAGRILRPHGGEDAVILDHAGNCAKHGLPQEDREYSLEPRRKRTDVKAPSTKTCPCFAVLPTSTKTCPRCGHSFEGDASQRGREIREVDGELVEVKPASVAERRAVFEALCRKAAERDYKPGYVLHAYKSKYGQWPPSQWSARKRVAELKGEAA
jgi:DNA repair protein RadD